MTHHPTNRREWLLPPIFDAQSLLPTVLQADAARPEPTLRGPHSRCSLQHRSARLLGRHNHRSLQRRGPMLCGLSGGHSRRHRGLVLHNLDGRCSLHHHSLNWPKHLLSHRGHQLNHCGRSLATCCKEGLKTSAPARCCYHALALSSSDMATLKMEDVPPVLSPGRMGVSGGLRVIHTCAEQREEDGDSALRSSGGGRRIRNTRLADLLSAAAALVA
ncbi:unnamed protein product [Lampetra planeri]